MNGRRIRRAVALPTLPLLAGIAALISAPAAAATSGPWIDAEWVKNNQWLLGALAGAWATLFGHLLVARRDAMARTNCPKIETAIQCEFLPCQGYDRPVELRFLLANKGGAKSNLSTLDFRIRAIHAGASLIRHQCGPACVAEGGLEFPHLGRLEFPDQIAKGRFSSTATDRFFIDPGTTQVFTFATVLPASAAIILVHCRTDFCFRRSALGLWLSYRRGYSEERMFSVESRVAKAAHAAVLS